MLTHLRLFRIVYTIGIITILFSGLPFAPVAAQGNDGLKREVNSQTGKVSFIGPESGQALSASKALGIFIRPQDPAMALAKRFAPEFGLKDPERELKEINSDHSEDGRITARYQQNYQGIPVMGGELIVNTNERGDLYSMNGEVSANLSLSIQPTVNSEQARETALQAMAKWYRKTQEDFFTSEPALWIYDESLLRASTRPVELVWRMDVSPKESGMPVRELVLVNAHRGGISLHFNQIDTAWRTSEDKEHNQSGSVSTSALLEQHEKATTSDLQASQMNTLQGLTWYVATTGRDSNSCAEPTAPCKTINAAIAKAPQWDAIIMVASGTYTGTGSNVVTVNKRLTLSGGWDSTFSTQNGASIIDGGGVRTGIRIDPVSTVVIDHFVIQNGHADTDGGGLYVHGRLTLRNSAVINNTAGRGAGLFTYSPHVGISNTTISGNHATASGGGIYAKDGSLGLYNATVAYNRSDQLGGGIAIEYSQVGLLNSIVANNSAITHGDDCYGFIDSSGYNIIGWNPGCQIYPHPGDQFNVDPLIDPSLTGTLPLHALQAGSPAINTGASNSCPAEDQRGLPRPEGSSCDIGSYEYAVPGLTIVGGAGQVVKTGSEFPLPFTVSVLDASLKRVPGVTVTFTAPATGASGIFADTGTRTTTVITDANGVATTSKFTTNATPGDYAVTASASGSSPIDFSLQAYAVRPLYVSTTGNDSNSCLAANSPCKTINAAIEKARDGDTIRVAMGTYTSSEWVVVEITKSITLSGGWDASFLAQSGLSTIDGGEVSRGLFVQSVTAGIERFVIENSFEPADSGSGITNSGTLVLRDSIVRDNSNCTSIGACYGGGAIANSGTLTVNHSTITGNLSAGILNRDYGVLTVNNSTISGNQWTGVFSLGSAVLNGTTVSGNAGGGIFFANDRPGDPTFTIRNTLVAGNWSTESTDCWGTITSAGYNLIGNNFGCTFTPTTGDKVGTSANPINPRLSLLQNNGGLTLTHALLSGSPAIDSGNPTVPGSGGNACLATDQRGVTRPAGTRCDIGAYEGSVPWMLAPLVNTYTAKNGSSLPGTFVCNQTSPNCPAGDLHAKAAHQYSIGTYNLFALQYGRDGINNNGMTIKSTVHYKSNYDNAFWDGNQMVYGDAYGFPLADDVVAHELTHGVTQYESNLFYYYQSGAINESFSDLWGEYYDQTNGQGDDSAGTRWLVGEDVLGLGAIRNMRDPWRFGDPEKMTSIYYHTGEEDNGGVHHNSGVNNHAIFLLVDGDGFNNISITRLGWAKTAAIYYEANTNLLTSGADYSDLYYALQRACSNLIGQKGITPANCVEVKDALDAVEMNGQPLPNFNSDAPYCPAGNPVINVFSDSLESGIGNWTFNNGAVPRWQWDSPYGSYARSGFHALYANDHPGIVTDATAKLIPLTIPSNAYLHFAQAYGFESGYNPGDSTLYHFDGGVLEYSINGGATWADASPLIDFNGYKGKIFAGTSNPLSGRNAFVGSSHGYISTRLKLAPLAGKTVIFRWRMGLDDGTSAWGWWVDNVRLYTCHPPPAAFHKTSPSNGVNNLPPSTTLRWGTSNGAASYQYCYDTTNDNACSNWISNGVSTSKVLNGLSPGTTYYWHVRAINSGGTTYANGSPTAFWSFTTMDTPAEFTKISPATSATGINLSTTLSWSSSTSAAYYQYCYDIINDNQCNRTWSNPTNETAVGISSLGANTTYYWQVRAINAIGSTDADNQNWGSFTTTSTVPAGTAAIETFISTVLQGRYSLGSGESLRESYSGGNNGPTKLTSTNAVPIIGAERVIYKVQGVQTSFSELMGLPEGQLDNVYWLPWYNNVDLDTQLRIANATNNPATVTVTIGSVEMPTLNLAAGESTRVSYADVNDGPVQILSDQNIIAAERVIYTVQGTQTSFSEMMALPESQLDTTYWLPWYNNVDLDTQLRIGNVSGSTATVHVFIGGEEVTPVEGITLLEGESTRLSYTGVNDGPMQIVSDQNIVAAERVIYKVNNVQTSFSEMMALPASQLDTTYWLPWYNNKDLDTQLRIGNVSGSTATVHIFIGGEEVTPVEGVTLLDGESTRVTFPTINDGPVQIVSDVPIVAAERVIYKVQGIQTSFSEMMALPASQLDSTYWFPWHNNVHLDTQLRFAVP